MSAMDTAKEIVRIGSTAGLSKDVIDLLEKKASLLAEQIVLLQKKNAMLTTKVSGLEIENQQLRAQLHNAPPVVGGFVESLGVRWKRTAQGFEPNPYCNECSHHPVMSPFPPDDPFYWVCSAGHRASFCRPPDG